MPKCTQAQVDYRRGYPLRQCSVCSMYVHEADGGQYGQCTAVTGAITPYGYCNLFDQLANPYGHRASKAHRRAIEDIYDHAHGYSVRK